MARKITAVRGVNDVLPPEIHLWHRLEAAARRIFAAYGYDEIRIPVIERTELFTRSIGAATDVVEKEMYTFTDKGGDSLTLRPEGTAGVVRAYVEHGIAVSDPSARYWYAGPMFRHERPQKGRYRQFWQIGAELFGQISPRVDAEQLAMLREFVDEVGLRDVSFQISSLGDDICRPPYKEALTAFLRDVRAELCEDCMRRVETNPLRVLDCKKEGCRLATKDAPLLVDRLCDPCAAHFAEVQRNLRLLGVPFELNPRIVRGLDYYVRTAYELVHVPGAVAGGAGELPRETRRAAGGSGELPREARRAAGGSGELPREARRADRTARRPWAPRTRSGAAGGTMAWSRSSAVPRRRRRSDSGWGWNGWH